MADVRVPQLHRSTVVLWNKDAPVDHHDESPAIGDIEIAHLVCDFYEAISDSSKVVVLSRELIGCFLCERDGFEQDDSSSWKGSREWHRFYTVIEKAPACGVYVRYQYI